MPEGREAVLFVDDEPAVLKSILRTLGAEPFDVLAAGSPVDAFALLEERPFAAVISDHRMAEMSGSEFLAEVRRLYPDTVRIIVTGYADVEAAVQAINQGEVYRYLSKPWHDHELKSVIRDAVQRYALAAQNRELLDLTLRQNAELRDLNAVLETTLLQTVDLAGALLELRSSIVGSHSKRVAELATLVAVAMGLGEEEVRNVRTAEALHDIGLFVLPDSLLRRVDGALPPSEGLIYRRHSIIGEQLVNRVTTFRMAARMVREHHECCDGSGFPDRKKRHQISVGGRILAAVNAYDREMNSRSKFRNATPSSVLQALRQEVPSRYEPIVFRHLADIVLGHSISYDEAQAAMQSDGKPCLPGRGLFGASLDEIGLRGSDLEPGMVLSRELRSASGLLLLPAGAELSVDNIARIRAYGGVDALLGEVFVLRTSLPPSPVADDTTAV